MPRLRTAAVEPPERLLAWVHGGVRFRIDEAPGTVALDRTYRASFHAPTEPAPLGEVVARIEHAPTREARAASRLSWVRGPGGYELVSPACHARFAPGRPGVLVARLGGSDGDLAPLLAATAALVGQLRGGLLLHAAGVVHAGKGFLFVGPSGAGKSTAVSLVRDALPLTWDRALVFPSGEGWRVAAVAGGSPAAYRLPSGATFELGGIGRIRHGRGKPARAELHAAERFLAVRESVFWATEPDEATCGERVERLAREVPVVALSTVLGASLDPLLERWGAHADA